MKKSIYYIVVLLLLSSCWDRQNTLYNNYFQPDIYYLNENKFDIGEISCLNLSDLDSVVKYADNALLLKEESRLAMALSEKGITQMKFDLTSEIVYGEGVRLSFRTICDDLENQQKISLDYTTEGSFLFENGNQIRAVDSIRANIGKKSRIIIENYGKLVNIVVDCDTVYYGPTELASSEQLIAETIGKTQVKLSGIIFSNMNNDIDIQYSEPIITR